MKIKFGAIITDGRGKIGGHVASKNRAGAYLRNKVTPINAQTSFQMNARNILTALSAQWRTLTDAQRAAWNDAVKDYATTDIFGDSKNPSGLNLFIKLNSNLSHSSQATIVVPPAKVEVPYAGVASATLAIGAGTGVVSFDSAELNGQKVLVSATAPLSAGVSYVKGLERVIGTFTVAAAAIDIFDEYTAKFGIPLAGANVHLSMKVIAATGQAGLAINAKTTVLA